MKKAFVLFILMVVVVFCLVAQSDPFATKRFLNKNMELSFRCQDSDGRAQVLYANDKGESQYYYNFDDECIALYDKNGELSEVFGYSFINEGSELRLYKEDGSFYDLKSDNGKTSSDKIWEAVEIVAQNFLLFGGTGAAIGFVFGGPAGSVIGLCVGGLLGIVKAIVHNIFGLI